MEKFTVVEHSKTTYVQEENQKITVNESKVEDYSKYSKYFNELLISIGSLIENVDLVLVTDDEATLLTLNLSNEDLPLAEKIKEKLLDDFPDEVEQVSLCGNTLNILEMFFEYHG